MLKLSAPQNIFLNGLNNKFNAYVGGFGSGKTFVGCLDLLIFLGRNPSTRVAYYGATYPSIRDIFYPTFDEAASMMGFTVDIKESNKEVHVFRNGRYYGTTICRSMEKPDTIVGYKVARALCDEIDTLPMPKANKAWNKIAARLRLKIPNVQNCINVTTTPEGFGFVHSKFAQNPSDSYSMVQASTYENAEFLPEDYIDSLIETYPKELINAYIQGQFVNLTSGTVYSSYDRHKHNSSEAIRAEEELLIGMDFNVTKQAATIYVKRNGGEWHSVDELVDMFDTPEAIRIIKNRYPDHPIAIYPDASGNNRKSVNASESDISLLREAGFDVRVNASNPAVKDRILATNKAFENGKLFINALRCPTVARCLEQQAWGKNGEPDKSSGNDHQNDATTYPIAHEMPIIKPIHDMQIRIG